MKLFSVLRRGHPFHFSRIGAGAFFFLASCLIGNMLLSACTYARSDVAQQTPSAQSPDTPAQAALGGVPAPNFHLSDQNGHIVSLAAMKGKVVVLTFWYTRCPDMCPLSAGKVYQTLTSLGKQAGQVAVLAASVDPANDTPTSARQFGQVHQLASYPNWHFLLGSQKRLEPVWKAYAISTDAAQGTSPQGQAISHMAIVYLIDQQGREQLMLPVNFTPPQLTRDIKQLLQGD